MGQLRLLAGGLSMFTGGRNSSGLAILPRVQEGLPRWDGSRESVALSGRTVNSWPGHELGEVAEPSLRDIEVHEEFNKLGREKGRRRIGSPPPVA